MILYDLFKKANVDEIVKIYEKQREEDEHSLERKNSLSPKEERELYRYFIDKMLEKTPKENKDESVLLGQTLINNAYFDEDIRFAVDVACYKKEELRKKRNTIEEIAKIKPAYEMSVRQIKDFLEASKPKNPNDWLIPLGYAYEFTEWETVLGWDVDEENVNEIGVNEFLAYVIDEMTFNGFFEESQKERRDELQKNIDEYEELMKLPKEEQEEHFVPMEELTEKLGLKKEDESEKDKIINKIEKEVSDVRFTYEAMYNLQSDAKMMLALLEKEENS